MPDWKNVWIVTDVIANSYLQTGYHIVEIYEEEVPMASGPGSDYYTLLIGVMVLVFVILSAVAYMFLCNNYRKRIMQLDSSGKAYSGKKLWKLKTAVEALEGKLAEESAKGIHIT